jgi:hypothetical protein
MTGLYQLYDASPEECFKELGDTLDTLKAQVAELAHRSELLENLFDGVVKNLATRPVAEVPATSWTYDVRLPNLYFKDVFEPEIGPGFAKRWVSGNGILRANLRLPRNVQYDFSIKVVDFPLPEYEETFYIQADGRRYNWLKAENRKFETIILEDPTAMDLEFEVGVIVSPAIGERNISFSFSEIQIRKHL